MDSYGFSGTMEIVGEHTYAIAPLVFELYVNPEADLGQLQNAARVITGFIADQYVVEPEVDDEDFDDDSY